MWPIFSRFIFKTCCCYARILISGTDEIILSKEGSTQGDPLGMLIYGIGVIPLIVELKSDDIFQNWYADDSIGLGRLIAIRVWFYQDDENRSSRWVFP